MTTCKIAAALENTESQQTRSIINVLATDPTTPINKAAELLAPYVGSKVTSIDVINHREGICECGPSDMLNAITAATIDGFHRDAASRDRRFTHPTGWEPRVKMDPDGDVSEVVSYPVREGTEYDAALHETLNSMGVGLRPDQEAYIVEIKTGQDWFRGEQGEDAVTRPSIRLRWNVRFKSTTAEALDQNEMENLWAQADKISKKARPAIATTNRALLVSIADWQIGQADGDGLRGQVRRAARIGATIKAEQARLKKAGTPVDSIYLIGLGDIVEGCDGFYANQAYTVQADRREQVKIARRLLLKIVTAAAETGCQVVVTGVAGNHGEHRSRGKMFTTPADNDDLAILEQVYDIIDGRPGYENVAFSIPNDRLVATLAIYDHVIAYTHGHVFPSGGGAAAKSAKGWWERQAFARERAGDASVLFAGHLHHFNVTDLADGRLFIQAPAICDRSQHFAERYGLTSRAGLQTCTIAAGREHIDNIKIHSLDDNDDILEDLR